MILSKHDAALCSDVFHKAIRSHKMASTSNNKTPVKRHNNQKRKLKVGAAATGVIVRLNSDKGWGFVSVVGKGDVGDLYFHRTHVPETEWRVLIEGACVELVSAEGEHPKGGVSHFARISSLSSLELLMAA